MYSRWLMFELSIWVAMVLASSVAFRLSIGSLEHRSLYPCFIFVFHPSGLTMPYHLHPLRYDGQLSGGLSPRRPTTEHGSGLPHLRR